MKQQLFRVCTSIKLGNGHNMRFRHDRWFHSSTPAELAPSLLRFAWRKNLTVAKALQGRNWMRSLQCISSPKEVRQFVILWRKVNEVQLFEQPNDIIWRLIASGNNSASSAYATQFMGACPDHDWASVWSVKAENKCKILCCLILQNKLWTVDRIINTSGQSNPICQLCRMYLESAMHMIALCPFASSV
jgi:hypothetical protein